MREEASKVTGASGMLVETGKQVNRSFAYQRRITIGAVERDSKQVRRLPLRHAHLSAENIGPESGRSAAHD